MKNRKRLIPILAGVMAAIMILTLVMGVLPSRASAASSSEIRRQINSLQQDRKDIKEQIAMLQEQAETTSNELSDIIRRKNIIDQEIGLLHTEIANINEQIAAYNVLIADRQDELDRAEKRFSALNDDCKVRIRAMEEEGAVSYWEVLFKANSFSDLLDRLNMVEEIAASDTRRLQELSDAANRVSAAQAELTQEKAALELTRADLDIAQAELDRKRIEADDVIVDLLAKGRELNILQEDLEKEDEELLAEIARKEREYNEAKNREWLEYMATYTTVPPTTQAPSVGISNPDGSNNFISGGESSTGGSNSGFDFGNGTGSSSGNTGSFDTGSGNTSSGGSSSGSSSGNTNSGITVGTSWRVPCSYVKLTSPFGLREAPTAGASTYHQGVDLSAPAGTPIYASRGGTVTTASYGSTAGYYVTINHGDGFSSIYMHMTNYVVSAGSQVSQGQLIGYVGKTGVATGNHLHFGIAYNGGYVNPCSYVGLY